MHAIKSRYQLTLILLLLFLVQSCRTTEPVVPPETDPPRPQEEIRAAADRLLESIYETGQPVDLPPGVYVESVSWDGQSERIHIFMNERFSYVPLRPSSTYRIYELLNHELPDRFEGYEKTIISLQEPIEELVPNYFRLAADPYDYQRMPYVDERRPEPVVERLDRHFVPEKGLPGRQIAMWHSHGWYYDQVKNRWEWQRPRLFQTVEDLLPMAFTIPYIIPMLENAGAYVWLPRERDIQTNEVVVDFDGSSYNSRVLVDGDWMTAEPGFAIGSPPYEDDVNPFRQGFYKYLPRDFGDNDTGETERQTRNDGENHNDVVRDEKASVQWIPEIPECGKYAVYISYASLEKSSDQVLYSVFHRGGQTDFRINQAIGGGTWVYLGHFEFEKGMNPDRGRVELRVEHQNNAVITADAVRFGGGMGSIQRDGQISGRARYLEAARYYMQYAGMPDSLVYNLSDGESDVVDDFRGRGEWVNYLKGAPYGPDEDRDIPGLGIPIDLSLAFHTDAGITRNDTVVGTLMIYSIEDGDSLRKYPDEISRLANRDFADILQTGIVEELRNTWDPAWNRRSLFNRMYSEAFRPNTPAALLELLSHQNFLDMQFAQDPRFRFDVSRAIYKSMLRYLADRYQQEYIVQPLPVSNFRVIPEGEGDILLRWNPVPDTLEPSADPDRYIVYKKRGDEPFDRGRVTEEPEYRFDDLQPGMMYQFKVRAANEGGRSFPSETLAAMLDESSQGPLLIVNGFERISGPAVIDEPGFKGFAPFLDAGVPDHYDLHFTGEQFDFDPESEWQTNDAPGHGASYADHETRVIAGNTFDFPAVYGEALQQLGLPFVSTSVAAIRSRQLDMTDYEAVILITGNQKTTFWPKHHTLGRDPQFHVFPLRLREEIDRYLNLGGRLFISGSHVGTDAMLTDVDNPGAVSFINESLRFVAETNHAVRTGGVRSVSESFMSAGYTFSFNTDYHPEMYRVDAPDALEPYEYPESDSEEPDDQNTEAQADAADRPSGSSGLESSGPETLIRYEENRFSAGVGFRSHNHAAVTFGFPFETIMDPADRVEVMRGILQYLGLDIP